MIPRSILKENGANATLLAWVDTKRDDRLKPNARSRMCGQHCKRGAHAAVSLSPENLFNAMPQLLMSLKTPRSASKDGHVLLIAHFDISRTHFTPRAQREVFVMEDPAKARANVEQLERSTCGTQDAGNLWHGGPRVCCRQPPTQRCSSAYKWMQGCWCSVTTVLLGDATVVTGLHELLNTQHSGESSLLGLDFALKNTKRRP